MYTACQESAYATYILTIVGCVGTGVGVGVGSAGWAVPVGGALAGACCAAAQVKYDADKKNCYYSYKSCKGIK